MLLINWKILAIISWVAAAPCRPGNPSLVHRCPHHAQGGRGLAQVSAQPRVAVFPAGPHWLATEGAPGRDGAGVGEWA